MFQTRFSRIPTTRKAPRGADTCRRFYGNRACASAPSESCLHIKMQNPIAANILFAVILKLFMTHKKNLQKKQAISLVFVYQQTLFVRFSMFLLMTLSLVNSSRSFSSKSFRIISTVFSSLGITMFFKELARFWAFFVATAKR